MIVHAGFESSTLVLSLTDKTIAVFDLTQEKL